MADKIAVLDFGSQYTHLLARRVRELHVFSEIFPSDILIERLKGVKGIILSGGPSSVYEKESPKPDSRLFSLNIPILGLCYGHQLLAELLGGKVTPGNVKEYGLAELKIKNKKDLFSGLDERETVWMSHGDFVEKMPKGFEIIGSTHDCKIAAMTNGIFFGLQFHPEVTHTPKGMKILENFAIKICKCKREWTMQDFIEKKIEEIKAFAKNKNVFLLVSGGVDSTVCFSLLVKALGEGRVYGLFIDNGFMRKNETAMVKKLLSRFKNFHVYDASKEFLEEVNCIINPEEKRKIIGNKFIEVANNAIKKLKLEHDKWILGQGTIYPDTIESGGTKHADVIKTHHNRIGAVRDLIKEGKIIEPISQLYKDEVRGLGLELGLPDSLVFRHPFPGPGLAIRCLCSDGKEKIQNKDKLEEEINKQTGNLKAIILPVKSVGVQGDSRTYRHPVALVGKSEWKTLENISTRVTNEFREINRVVYLIAPDDLSDFNLKKKFLTKERLDLLREADYIAMKEIEKAGLMKKIWQMSTVLIPFGLNGESIVLRPVFSKEVMTLKFADIDFRIVKKIAEKIMKLGVDAVFYDITHKPPATLEWE